MTPAASAFQVGILLTFLSSFAAAAPADAWLEGLQERVAGDLSAGRPLVVQAHVALCDNRILRCGGHGLGDGDRPETNLYWSTSGGLRGWFGRPGSGWKLVHEDGGDGKDVLAITVWRRRYWPAGALRRRGVTGAFDVYVVAWAWRGARIDAALDAYVADLYGDAPRAVTLDDGTVLLGGGAAQIVAYVGHNRWMDRPDFDWPAAPRPTAKGNPKGTIAVACMTADYLGDEVPSATRVPLLLTRDFLFAGSHALEGALHAFASGEGYAAIRSAAAGSYATGEGKTVAHVQGAFTNPADRRWHWRGAR